MRHLQKGANSLWYVLSLRNWGSGCSSVGGAVASYSRGTRFESSHRQNLY